MSLWPQTFASDIRIRGLLEDREYLNEFADAAVEIPTGAGLLRELKAGEAGFTILRNSQYSNV